jgi:hypothetical protein
MFLRCEKGKSYGGEGLRTPRPVTATDLGVAQGWFGA